MKTHIKDTDYTLTRGRFIESAAMLEHMLDAYISGHFTTDEVKRSELICFVLPSNRMTFENKRQIFKLLAERHDPTLIKKYPTIFKDLTAIIKYRNAFAHFPSASLQEKDGIKKQVLLDTKTTLNFITYTKEEVEKQLDLMVIYIQAIGKL